MNTPTLNQLTFHHLGLACRDFGREIKFLALLGYVPEDPVYIDVSLGIECQFLVNPVQTSLFPRIELVRPLPNSTVLDEWLRAGTKIYHMAFYCDDFEGELRHLQTQRAKILVPPTPAVAFQNKHVCFLMLGNMQLIELIEQ